MQEIEISQIDTRFEQLRLKDKTGEKVLLSSILEQGIREPLQCVEKASEPLILLDGFKRLRCAIKIGIKAVPVVSLGSNTAVSILQFLRLSNNRGLNILEQAALVDELKKVHSLSVSHIAHHLERSPAWVSVRLGIIEDMSPVVKEAVFSGKFPVRSYMYTLRHFTRVNKIKKSEIDIFVKSVSSKGLSTRSIATLAHGFFRGGQNLKEQIQKGNLDWTLNQLRQKVENNTQGLNETESRTLRDLELIQKFVVRVPYQLNDTRLKGREFLTQAHLLLEGILYKSDFFISALKDFYGQREQK